MFNKEQVEKAGEIAAQALMIKDIVARKGSAIKIKEVKTFQPTDKSNVILTDHNLYIPAFGIGGTYRAEVLAKGLIGADYEDQLVNDERILDVPYVYFNRAGEIFEKSKLRMTLDQGEGLLRFCYQAMELPDEMLRTTFAHYARYRFLLSDGAITTNSALRDFVDRLFI